MLNLLKNYKKNDIKKNDIKKINTLIILITKTQRNTQRKTQKKKQL